VHLHASAAPRANTSTPVPPEIGFEEIPINPATPNRPLAYKPSRYLNPDAAMGVTDAHGVGPKRVYLDLQSHPPDVAYPPRPVPGSVADMDEIMRHCDFSKNKVTSLLGVYSLPAR